MASGQDGIGLLSSLLLAFRSQNIQWNCVHIIYTIYTNISSWSILNLYGVTVRVKADVLLASAVGKSRVDAGPCHRADVQMCALLEPKSLSRNLADFSSPHLTPSPEACDVSGGVAGVVLYVRIPRGVIAPPPLSPYHLISGDITFHGSGGGTDSLSSVSARARVRVTAFRLFNIHCRIPVGVVSGMQSGSGRPTFIINSVKG